MRKARRRAYAVGGFLLDGFPRTIPQAQALDQIVQGRHLIIVEIVLTEAEVLHRLASRLACEECGTNAQDTGGRQTEPLVEYYCGRPTFHRVNGAQLPDDVTSAIVRSIESTT